MIVGFELEPHVPAVTESGLAAFPVARFVPLLREPPLPSTRFGVRFAAAALFQSQCWWLHFSVKGQFGCKIDRGFSKGGSPWRNKERNEGILETTRRD